MHPDFGSGVWPPGSTSPIGIPVTEDQRRPAGVEIIYTDYGDESDPGPFPIPSNATVEGGPSGSGDRHVSSSTAPPIQSVLEERADGLSLNYHGQS